jgi:hypothetical protein
MEYSKEILKSSGNKSSPFFRQFLMRELSDKCLCFVVHCIQRHLNEPDSALGYSKLYGNIVQYFLPICIVRFPEIYE